MSSSVKDDADVTYTLTFTPSGTSIQSFIIDWCDDSPVIGDSTCSAPAGFDAKTGVSIDGTNSSAALGTLSIDGTNSTASHTVIKGTTADTGSSAFTLILQHVHNPSAVEQFYARVYTYSAADPTGPTPDANGYQAPDNLGSDEVDDGGIAMSTVEAIGVQAAVRETLSFCVASVDITKDCSNAAANAPSLTLGEGSGSNKALTSSALSTGIDYAQLSTNAAHGAVVNLKNSNDCGGLRRNGEAGVTACDIAPQTDQTAGTGAGHDVVAGSALFGIKTGTVTSATDATNPTGTLAPVLEYGNRYFMDYNSGSPTTLGVTSPYGSEFFNTGGAPTSNKNIPFTFGASIGNDTPAGLYTATISLVATGTY